MSPPPRRRNLAVRSRQSAAWEERYRERWRWDRVGWGSHCVDCYPTNCPFRVYVRDGVVAREEQSGSFRTIEQGVPDMNPAGCQKGASWSQLLDGQERVLHPLKRAGERGEGKWQRISWDEALTEIAEAMLDAIQEVGPESIVRVGSPGEGGTQSIILAGAVMNRLGGTVTDIQAEINDFNPGLYITFGKFDPVASVDDWFHSELLITWANNPVFSAIPWYHYATEARYNGAELVTIGPDYSPSAVHADRFVPVRMGSDAALALSICQVLVEEGLADWPFVQEQTDLPLLVRRDSRRYLRASDVEEGGREDQFYVYDARAGRIVEAPRGTLDLGGVDAALEGSYRARLADGGDAEVTPVFALLRQRLEAYRPEEASKVCGVSPEVIRLLARKIARRKTRILLGWTTGKSYHGDLMERAICLVLALSGNWGSKGTGTRSWAVGMFDGMFLFLAKAAPGQEATAQLVAAQRAMLDAAKAADPGTTDEIALAELAYAAARMGGMIAPALFWYYHCGYREVWNRPEWNDPAMPRSFDAYVQEALSNEWWVGSDQLLEGRPPRVLFEIGGNLLRRQRGGQNLLLRHLWPKLRLIVSMDWRMTTTGLYSDFVLPAAQHYEKTNFCYTSAHVLNLTLSDRVVPPAGEAKSEWEFSLLLAKKVEESAKARGLLEYQTRAGMTIRLEGLYDAITMNGAYADEDKAMDEMVRDSVVAGTLPEGTTLETMREKGHVRFTDWGVSPMALAQASDLKPDETHSPFRWHTEKKMPFPTLTRRAQFYVDHAWFLEAGEELPMHKEGPSLGGDYPLSITGGHPRWSVNSMNMTNRVILNTHRGEPFVMVNPRDAEARGIENGETVRVYNDVSSMNIEAKVSPTVRPGQVIIYNGWEPYQFRRWTDTSNVEPGMVKWLHLAGGYGHLRYRAMHWQPMPIDRHIRVEMAKVG